MDNDYPRRASKKRNNQGEQQQIQYKNDPEIDEAPRRKTNAIKRERPDVAPRPRQGRGRRRGGRHQQDDQVVISLLGGTEITIRQRDRLLQDHNTLREAGCREREKVMRSMLTLAAEHKVLETKSVITLRLMLHSCSSYNTNTNSLTERAKYYDPGMEEVKRLLLESNISPYSKIDIELVLEDGTQWTTKRKFPLRKIKKGRHLQHHSVHHSDHHPDQLVDFPLEAKVDAAPLSCHLEINIHYTHPNHIQNYLINLDYPSSFTPSHRNSEVQADLLEKIFIAIARNIGPDFGQLAIRLGIKQHDRHEIERNHQTAFDRNFEMLSRWRMMCPELATVENLINVLRECGRKDLAETVHRKSSITNPTPKYTGSLPKPQDSHVSEEEKDQDDEEEQKKGLWQENESPRWKKKGETVQRTAYTRQRRTSSPDEEQSQDEQDVWGEGKKEGDEEKENREYMTSNRPRRYQQVKISDGDDSEDDKEKAKQGEGKFMFKPRSNTT